MTIQRFHRDEKEERRCISTSHWSIHCKASKLCFTPLKLSSATHCTASDGKCLVVKLQHQDYLVQIQDWKLICGRMWEAAERRKIRGEKRNEQNLEAWFHPILAECFQIIILIIMLFPSNTFSLMTKSAPAIPKLTAHQLTASFGQLI